MSTLYTIIPIKVEFVESTGYLPFTNDTGAFIFEHLQKGTAPEETAQALTQEYDVALDTAAIDVQNTIKSLIEAGVAEA